MYRGAKGASEDSLILTYFYEASLNDVSLITDDTEFVQCADTVEAILQALHKRETSLKLLVCEGCV